MAKYANGREAQIGDVVIGSSINITPRISGIVVRFPDLEKFPNQVVVLTSLGLNSGETAQAETSCVVVPNELGNPEAGSRHYKTGLIDMAEAKNLLHVDDVEIPKVVESPAELIPAPEAAAAPVAAEAEAPAPEPALAPAA